MEFEDDPHPDGPVEWADNRLSNFLAAASTKLLPNWCQTPEHWTSRLAQHLFTDCPCCLLFRGLALGAAAGAIVTGIIAIITAAIIISIR